MIYPEPFVEHHDRYLNFLKHVLVSEFENFSTTERKKIMARDAVKDKSKLVQDAKVDVKNQVVVLVSHGNSVPKFYELVEPIARTTKFIIGIGYCCVSIL